MIVEEYFSFEIRWNNIKTKNDAIKRTKEFLVNISWLESIDDVSYNKWLTFSLNEDCTVVVSIKDKRDVPKDDEKLAEELFSKLKDLEDVERIRLLKNSLSLNMIFENVLDAPFNTQETKDWFVIYAKSRLTK